MRSAIFWIVTFRDKPAVQKRGRRITTTGCVIDQKNAVLKLTFNFYYSSNSEQQTHTHTIYIYIYIYTSFSDFFFKVCFLILPFFRNTEFISSRCYEEFLDSFSNQFLKTLKVMEFQTATRTAYDDDDNNNNNNNNNNNLL